MTNADVARLAVQLDLTGNFTSALGAAEQKVGSFSTNVAGRASGAFGTLERAAGRVGGALGHAGNQIKSLVTGPLGILGLGGALIGLGSFFDGALHKTEDFGLALEKLTGLTGESAQSMGALILLADKYGISSDRLAQIVGFTEKTLGKLNETTAKGAKAQISAALANLEQIKLERAAAGLSTTKINKLIAEQKARDALNASNAAGVASETKLVALDQLYGISLVDSTGKVKDFSAVLGAVADYYTGTAAQSTKAALAAQVFGRGYATLLPILQLGSKGIAQQEQAYKDLGLQLGTNTTDTLTAFRGSMRQLGEAINIVQLQLGLAFAPMLTNAANSITLFLEHGGAKQLVNFFTDAAHAAQTAGGIIVGFAQSAIGFWNTIPGPFRDLLVKGFIADKTVKFLFGFDPAAAGFHGLETAIKNAFIGAAAKTAATSALGKLVAQHVWVDNMGFGSLGPAGPAGPLEEAGGLGLVAASVGLAVAAGVVVAGGEILRRIINPNSSGNPLQTRAPNAYQAEYRGIFAAVSAANATRREDLAAIKDSDTGLASIYADRRETLAAIKDSTDGLVAAFTRTPDWLKRWEASLHPLNALSKTIHGSIANLLAGRNVSGSAAFLAAHLGISGVGAGGLPQAQAALAALKALLVGATGGNRSAILDAIHKIESRLPRLEDNAKNLRLADQIARSSETQKQKLADLDTVMKDVRAHGDKTTQTRIQALINAVKHQKTNVHITLPVQVVSRSRTIVVTATNVFGDQKYGPN